MHLDLKNRLCILSARGLAPFQTLAALLHLALVSVCCHECVPTYKHHVWEPPGPLLAKGSEAMLETTFALPLRIL